MNDEKWFTLLEGAYNISNYLRIYSIPYRKIMKSRIDKYGYEVISLKNGFADRKAKTLKYFNKL